MAKLKGYLSTARPLNSIGTGVGIALMLSMFSRWRPDLVRVAVGFITGFVGTSSAMMINDYVDREVDKVNKPWKPIPSGRADPKVVLAIGFALYTSAIALNLTLGFEVFFTTTFYATVSVVYSFLRRFWWSQLIVPLSTTSVLIYSYVSSGRPAEYEVAVVVLFTSIYLANLAREIAKAIQDLEGDRKAGYATIPVRFGEVFSTKAMFALGVLAVALNYLVYLVYAASTVYFILITVANLVFLKQFFKVFTSFRKTGLPLNKSILEDLRKRSLYSFLLAIIAYSTLKLP